MTAGFNAFGAYILATLIFDIAQMLLGVGIVFAPIVYKKQNKDRSLIYPLFGAAIFIIGIVSFVLDISRRSTQNTDTVITALFLLVILLYCRMGDGKFFIFRPKMPKGE